MFVRLQSNISKCFCDAMLTYHHESKRRMMAVASATKYEALLAEQRSKPLSKDTALLAFRVLDQLLPNMGVFQRVTKMCRDQLFGTSLFALIWRIVDSGQLEMMNCFCQSIIYQYCE